MVVPLIAIMSRPLFHPLPEDCSCDTPKQCTCHTGYDKVSKQGAANEGGQDLASLSCSLNPRGSCGARSIGGTCSDFWLFVGHNASPFAELFPV